MAKYAKISALCFPHYPADGEYDRERYKKNITAYLRSHIDLVLPENPDLIVFSSYFKGLVWTDVWAAKCGAYLAASLVLRDAGRIINPFGTVLAGEDNKYHVTATLNLDFMMIHNDDNQDWRSFKLDEAKRKYGDGFNWVDSNGGGMSIIQSDLPDKSVEDIIEEFNIIRADEYFPVSYNLRNEYYKKIGFNP